MYKKCIVFLFLMLINCVNAFSTQLSNKVPVITINKGYISKIQVSVYDIFSSDLSFDDDVKDNLWSIINNDLKSTNLITVTNKNLIYDKIPNFNIAPKFNLWKSSGTKVIVLIDTILFYHLLNH